jgi:hypothetical protein
MEVMAKEWRDWAASRMVPSAFMNVQNMRMDAGNNTQSQRGGPRRGKEGKGENCVLSNCVFERTVRDITHLPWSGRNTHKHCNLMFVYPLVEDLA